MTDKQLLSVDWVDIGRLFCSPSNPRNNEPAVPHVAASLRRFGWQQPIVAKRSGEVIAGNTRLKAAQELTLARVPVIWFEGSELDALAYSIADNRTHEYSTWMEKDLVRILSQLREEDALEGVGYTADELDALVQALDEAELLQVIEDEPPEPPDAAITEPGDLWILGRHRLLCGDSSSSADMDRLLGGVKVHLVNMDPPYNVKVEPRSNNAIAAGLSSFSGPSHHQKLDVKRHPGKAKGNTPKMRAKDRPLATDFLGDREFEDMLRAWFGNAARVLVPGRAFYIWGGYGNIGNYPAALEASELYFSQAIIWVKEHPVLTRKDFMGNHEWCFYGWREGAAHHYYGPNNATDVWSVKKLNHTAMVHLTEKPVELAARAIQYSSHRDENVLDLFGGSGSTMAACEQTNRNGFLMEIDAPYCDVIVQRFEALSGKQAILEATGQTFADVTSARTAARPPMPAAAPQPRVP